MGMNFQLQADSGAIDAGAFLTNTSAAGTAATSIPVADALYFTDGGAVGLDLKKHAGAFDLQWINIATGTWAGREVLQGGRVVRIKAPAKGHWAAAVLRTR